MDDPQFGHMIKVLEYKTISTGCVLILKYVRNIITISFSYINTQDGLEEKVLALRGFLQMLYTL